MRKILFACLMTFAILLCCQAQDKPFKEGIKNGRVAGKPYGWVNTKGKMLKWEQMEEYARNNKIFILNHTTKEIARFGDATTTVGSIDFIPLSEMASYVMENATNMTSIPTTIHTGTAFVYYLGDRIKQHYVRCDNAIWTGQVNNGLIDGQGTGSYQISPTEYIVFKGTFSKGIMQGQGKIYQYENTNRNALYSKKCLKEAAITMGNTSEGLTWFKAVKDTGYGYINQDGIVIVKPEFKTVSDFHEGKALVSTGKVDFYIDKQGRPIGIKGGKIVANPSDSQENIILRGSQSLEESLKAGIERGEYGSAAVLDRYNESAQEPINLLLHKSASKTGYDKCNADVNLLNDFIERLLHADKTLSANYGWISKSIYEFYNKHPQYDKCQAAKTAKILYDRHIVDDALKARDDGVWFWTGYEDTFLGGKRLVWHDDYADMWRNTFINAINICKNGSNSPFSSYYSESLPTLAFKKEMCESDLAESRRWYEDALAKEQMALSDLTIDYSRIKRPSGKLIVINSLFDQDKWYSEEGIIYFKGVNNGHVRYNIIIKRDDGKTSYKIMGASNYDIRQKILNWEKNNLKYEYSTEQQMLNAIESALK